MRVLRSRYALVVLCFCFVFVILRSCGVGILWSCDRVISRSCDIIIFRSCDLAILWSYDLVTLRSCDLDIAMLLWYHVVLFYYRSCDFVMFYIWFYVRNSLVLSPTISFLFLFLLCCFVKLLLTANEKEIFHTWDRSRSIYVSVYLPIYLQQQIIYLDHLDPIFWPLWHIVQYPNRTDRSQPAQTRAREPRHTDPTRRETWLYTPGIETLSREISKSCD